MRCQHAPLLLALVLSGCALPLPVRALTYAPSFQYIERPRLKTAMWKLADGVTALEMLLRTSSADEVIRDDILQVLDDMQAAASTISAPGQQTNHPRIDQELPRFQLEIAQARAAAAREPPLYAPALDLSSACVRCHSGRR